LWCNESRQKFRQQKLWPSNSKWISIDVAVLFLFKMVRTIIKNLININKKREKINTALLKLKEEGYLRKWHSLKINSN
jgi:hypothetical protein